MVVKKLACSVMVMALALVVGCTAPRGQEVVLIEPTFSHHREQAAVVGEDAWPVMVDPFADRPVQPRFEDLEADERGPGAFVWPHTP